MQTFQHGQERPTPLAEVVLHPRRHLTEDAPADDGIGLQLPQLGRQHLVAHPHQGALQGRKPLGTFAEPAEDQQLPAAAHHPQGQLRRAELGTTGVQGIGERGRHGELGYRQVPQAQAGAFLSVKGRVRQSPSMTLTIPYGPGHPHSSRSVTAP
jgi:hypothetical protein